MAAIPTWTRDDEKRFESALVLFPEGSPYFLESIAGILQKPVEEVKYYYDALVNDIALIDSGMVPLPNYPEDDHVSSRRLIDSGKVYDHVPLKEAKKGKRGTPWSKQEHRLFLDGLEKYGQGDWKSISRDCVKTRSSTQVASHAQKYFLRQNIERKRRKRSSIHDITLENADNETFVPGSNLESMGGQNPPEYIVPLQDNVFSNDEEEQYKASLAQLTATSSFPSIHEILGNADNETFVPNFESTGGQHQHFGVQNPPQDNLEHFFKDNFEQVIDDFTNVDDLILDDADDVTVVPGSNLETIAGEQQHFGDLNPLEYIPSLEEEEIEALIQDNYVERCGFSIL